MINTEILDEKVDHSAISDLGPNSPYDSLEGKDNKTEDKSISQDEDEAEAKQKRNDVLYIFSTE